MAKRPPAKTKRPASKYEKIIGKKKMTYKCVGKTEVIKHIIHQEKNEHGAMNNITKSLPYFTLSFQYYIDTNRPLSVDEEPPLVLNAHFLIETRDKSISDKYQVGEEYKELPVSV